MTVAAKFFCRAAALELIPGAELASSSSPSPQSVSSSAGGALLLALGAAASTHDFWRRVAMLSVIVSTGHSAVFIRSFLGEPAVPTKIRNFPPFLTVNVCRRRPTGAN